MSVSNNALLNTSELPLFDKITAEDVVPAITQLIKENNAALQQLLTAKRSPLWSSVLVPFEEREDLLSKAFSPVGHLNSVANSEPLRQAYTETIAQLTQYNTELGQNKALFNVYSELANSEEFSTLSEAQQRSIKNALTDFQLAGVDLPEEKQRRFKEIKQRLSELSTQFSNNVMDATQGWYFHTMDEQVVAGIPETALGTAKQVAESKNLTGYVLTLDVPAYLAVMTHADDQSLRETLYRAYVSRASDQGMAMDEKNVKVWDNTALIDEILSLRHELALLLGYNNYAEYSLAKKMADTPEEVLAFLYSLAEKAKPAAQRELDELKTFVKKEFNIDHLEPWDIAYYSEKQRQAVYAVSQEELRPYFPVSKVVAGLFDVVGRLFNVEFLQDAKVKTWHPDAAFYWLKRDGKNIAGFYIDLFARENKRGGAWMDECRVRRKTTDGMQLPIAYLTCNFSAPTKTRPSLLTHMEVTTLFHEFGHGLHHMLTKIDAPAVSGINGVAWDAVELPSQFLENWCWEPSVIPLISGHFETGEPLPDALLGKLLKAKNFQSAMQTVRQLEFALFDFRLHTEYDNAAEDKSPQHKSPQQLLDEVRDQVAVIKPPAFNKFQNSFSHIFAGGYAAGYYSYKWAEVLSADAFSLFEENGIFDKATANKFLKEILEMGGSREAMDLFIAFRGRKPTVDALLRHNGIV